MNTWLSASEFEEAEAAIRSSQSHQPSKGEQTVNTIEDKFRAVSSSQKITGDIATAEFLLVKDQVTNFVENSKILVSVLEKLGEIHPVIKVAVTIFAAAIQLESTRRMNDEKLLTLHITMCEMMSTLKLLEKVASTKEPAEDGFTIKARLQVRMGAIIESIKSCAKLCDSYQRRHLAIKYLTSLKWQAKFATVAGQFIAHRDKLQSDLQIHITTIVADTSAMISTLNHNMAVAMTIIFDLMQSPEEREFAKLVERIGSKGGVLDDEGLWKEIMKQQPQEEEEKGPKFPRALADFRNELKKDVDTVLAENNKMFNQRFDQRLEAIESSLKEVKVTIRREGDRTVEAVLTGISMGPHERILDPDIYHIWKEMVRTQLCSTVLTSIDSLMPSIQGWKGSVKATHFIMAVHDHFSAKSALNEINAIVNKPNPTHPAENLRYIASSDQRELPETPAADLWSLEFVTCHRAQPLIEALDDDGSSFITVNEVNTFTSSRPKGWSLPRWIAYWTVGFEMTTQWYYRRIRRLFSLLSASSKGVLPANRQVVGRFMRLQSINATQDLLSGLRNVDSWDGMDWVTHRLFLKFKDLILENERRMANDLQNLDYFIDQDNTLSAVTRGSRPELYVMPLLYLLMKRSHWVMEQAHDVVLHPRELEILHRSMMSIHYAVWYRVRKLQAIYKLHNIKKEEKLQNVFFGLFAYTIENAEMGPFWTQDFNKYNVIDDTPMTDLDVTEPELSYGPHREELDLDTIAESFDEGSLVGTGNQEQPVRTTQAIEALIGAWSGTYEYGWRTGSSDGPLSFSIDRHTLDGRFQCRGIDKWGPFTAKGRANGARITFLKEYENTNVSWRYNGLLNESRDEVSGHWGSPNDDDEMGGDDISETPGDDSEMGGDDLSEVGSVPTRDAIPKWRALGTFVLHRRPLDYLLCRPSKEEFRENKPRALWSLVRNVAKYWFQSQFKNFTWEAIRERRDKRHMYMELSGHEGSFDNPDDASAWAELVRTVHPSDLQLWRNIAQYKKCREPVHSNAICDHCAKSDLRSTRIMCIECSEGELRFTIDLCANCQTGGAHVEKHGKVHTPSHSVIQLRRVLLGMAETHSVLSYAKSLLKALSDKDSKKCTSCEKEISKKPYWYCTECEKKTFMCIECNNRSEKYKTWLLQQKASPNDVHDSVHTMVLNTQVVVHLSIEKRLAQLEAKLNKQAEEYRARFTKLEELLERMVNAIAPAT